MPVRLLSALLLVAVPMAAAQSTLHVVDVNGGPGSSYRQIYEAVAAASPGDRVLVRPGNYAAFRIDGKPLAIVGEPGASIGGFIGTAIQISGIPPGAECAVSGFAVNTGLPYTTTSILIQNCRGRVFLDSITAALGSPLTVTNSERVAMSRVGGGSGALSLVCTDSAVNASDCRFQGLSSAVPGGGAGAELTRSVVSFSGCTVRGADEFAFFLAGPAIRLTDSFVTATDDVTHLIVAGQSTSALPAVMGRGSLVSDPRVRLRSSGGAPLTEATVSTGTQALPMLVAGRPQAGARAGVRIAGTAGGNYAIALGLPADWRLVPGLVGARWLDPAASFVVGIGVLDASGRGTYTLRLPPGLGLVGVPLVWQGVADQGSGTPIAYSNPVAWVVRP